MKKTLLAAALFAGFAGAAQADTTVTLYGVLDTGIEYIHASSKAGSYSAVGMEGGGVEAGSRLGVKGEEDLGGGNQAFFNAVMGFNLNDGSSLQTGRTFGREAVVGLQSNAWGKLQFGRGTSIANDLMSGTNYSTSFAQNPGYADPFGTGYGEMGLGNIASSLDTNRYDNMVGYVSPVFGGFQVGADYSFNTSDSWSGGNTTSPNAGLNPNNATPMGTRTRAFDLGATYNNGPLFLGLTYSQQNVPGWTLTNGTTAKNSTTTLTTAPAGSGSIRQVVFAGSYDFTVLRVYGAYVRGWNGLTGSASAWTPGGETPNSIANGTTFSSLLGGNLYSGMKQNAFMLAVSAPITANLKVMAEYQHQTLGGGAWAAGNGSAMNGVSAGAQYNLSKRTNVYAVAGYVNGAQNVSGQKETVVFAGINHSF